MTRGIYAITCTATGEQYVGKALHIYRRWSQHADLLTNGQHPSPGFTRAWAEYGPAGFSWQILQVVEKARDLLRIEQEYITRLRPVYNQRNAFVGPRTPQPRSTSIGPRFTYNASRRTYMELAYLRAWRESRRMSQDELADRAQVMKSTIVRLEREPDASGARQAAILSTIGKLAKGLGITRQQLVYEDPEHPTKHVSGAA